MINTFYLNNTVFQIVLRGRGKPSVGGWEILKGDSLLGGGNLRESEFDHQNLFQS